MRKKNLLICFFILILAGLMGAGFNYWKNNALAFGLLPFGGKIKTVTYCCNGIKIKVGSPKGGTFMYSWITSRPYLYYQFWRPGPWALGTYSIGGSCVTITSECESSEPVQGTINMIGTSL